MTFLCSFKIHQIILKQKPIIKNEHDRNKICFVYVPINVYTYRTRINATVYPPVTVNAPKYLNRYINFIVCK